MIRLWSDDIAMTNHHVIMISLLYHHYEMVMNTRWGQIGHYKSLRYHYHIIIKIITGHVTFIGCHVYDIAVIYDENDDLDALIHRWHYWIIIMKSLMIHRVYVCWDQRVSLRKPAKVRNIGNVSLQISHNSFIKKLGSHQSKRIIGIAFNRGKSATFQKIC